MNEVKFLEWILSSLLLYCTQQVKKFQLDLGFGEPLRFLSAKVQHDWQVKKFQLDLGFG